MGRWYTWWRQNTTQDTTYGRHNNNTTNDLGIWLEKYDAGDKRS